MTSAHLTQPSAASSAHPKRASWTTARNPPSAAKARTPRATIGGARRAFAFAAAASPLSSSASSSAPPGTSTTVLVTPAAPPAAAAPAPSPITYHYHQLEVPQTPPGISLIDVTPQIRELITQAGLTEGCVHVLSRHTTTALTINENEARLMDDVRQFLSRLAPAGDPYLHNDLHMRPAPDNWPGGWAAWAAQEPRNAHSHLLSMLLGNTLTVPVTAGKLALGTWQSILLVELDGPRPRTVGVQLVGHTASHQNAQ